MKRILPLVGLCLAACMPMTVESEISACPAEGLASVSFHAGKPPGGTLIDPETLEDGGLKWDFSGNEGDVYLTCHYADGSNRLQKLAYQTKSCKSKAGGSLRCRSSI